MATSLTHSFSSLLADGGSVGENEKEKKKKKHNNQRTSNE